MDDEVTTPIRPANIFKNIPEDLADELVEVMAEAENIRIERILSRGQASRPGFWYDQEMDEFVLLLKGRARLVFNGENDLIEMKPGDYIHIPAHVKHRVEWTDADHDTVWLAIHYR